MATIYRVMSIPALAALLALSFAPSATAQSAAPSSAKPAAAPSAPVSASTPSAQPPVSATSPAAAPKAYMSQTYVDTTVMRALYVLNEASAHYSMNSSAQANAVNRARSILNDLKQKAKGDPNERYVAMKVLEVEAQIYLEEEEMRRIAEDKRILTANDLIRQYNAEANKFRPDFAMVRGIFRRMQEVDTRQANNIADHYNKRYRQVSQEALYSLEKALNSNDVVIARRELEYCEKNKNYLMISSSQLASQRTRLDRLQGASTDMPRVLAALDAGEKAYREYRLSESRANLTMAQNRLNEIREHLPSNEGSEAAARAERAMNALDVREDSLVKLNLAVLDKQGPDAAIEYLQNVLQKRMQISSERSSIVDQAILRVRPDRVLESKVKMIEADTTEGSRKDYEAVLGVQNKAMRRAQEKADSLRKVRDKVANVSNNIYTLLQHNKFKDATRLFNKEKAFLSSAMEKSAFATLESYVQNGDRAAAAARANLDKNREKAEDYMARIYGLVEQNNVKEAYKRFNKYRKPLSKYLDRESYQMLEITVTQSYEQAFAKKK
ncbi:hypothetical protein R80B4_01431 [Fibrobacteres bacterium R8-0-B4]